MKYLVLTMTLLTPSFVCSGTAQPEYEPCYLFEVEESFAAPGQPAKSRKESHFTIAELPWTPLSALANSDLQGFVSTRVNEDLQFQGKKVSVAKVTWKRDPTKGPANIRASLIHFWTSDEVPTPSFPLMLGRGTQLQVPAGCVRLEVVPPDKNSQESEGGGGVAASGEYEKATTYKLGDKSLPAHEFTYSVPMSKPKGTWTVTLSRDIPGGLCSIQLDGDFSAIMRVVAMTVAPLPRNLDAFPEARFSYAPPAGYTRSAKPEQGELVRYVKGKDAFISIGQVKLEKDGLDGLARRMQAAKDAELSFTGTGRYRHVAGHPSIDAASPKAGLIFTEHAGQGYRIAISNLGELPPDEVKELLRGWRWMKR